MSAPIKVTAAFGAISGIKPRDRHQLLGEGYIDAELVDDETTDIAAGTNRTVANHQQLLVLAASCRSADSRRSLVEAASPSPVAVTLTARRRSAAKVR